MTASSHVEYQVDLDTYRGPLDLLLYLVKRDEVDIRDIPIARGRSAPSTPDYCFFSVNAVHETWECQFTKVPLGFCFQAQTCSV